MIERNKELKHRSFSIREYDHLLKRHGQIKTKIEKASVELRNKSNEARLTPKYKLPFLPSLTRADTN